MWGKTGIFNYTIFTCMPCTLFKIYDLLTLAGYC